MKEEQVKYLNEIHALAEKQKEVVENVSEWVFIVKKELRRVTSCR